MFKIDEDTFTMTIVKKDTASIDITLNNYELSEGDIITFTVASKVEQENPLLQKVITQFPDGIATVFLTSEDTNLDIGTYLYDIQLDTQDHRVDTIVGPAKFKVVGGITF